MSDFGLHPLLRSFYEELDPQKRYGILCSYLAAIRDPASGDSAMAPGSSGVPSPLPRTGTQQSEAIPERFRAGEDSNGTGEAQEAQTGPAQASKEGAPESLAALSVPDAYRIELFNARFAASVGSSLFGTGAKRRRASGSTGNSAAPVPAVPGEADFFLRDFLTLLSIFKNSGLFPKRLKKEVRSILRNLQLDDRPLQDKACENVLYMEIRNAVRRYFVTCHDSSYGRKFLGMASASEEERESLRCKDTWGFSFGIADLLELAEEMETLCRAANDEYCASVPDAESLPAAYRYYGGKHAGRR
ncbi:MAG: hypothetical protein Q4D81_01690 [Eubacteriales bacterium]|nr:hypothetical protein [Eubacteriales bacterium]